MTLFFDLDGPILDVSERYFRLHCALVTKLGGKSAMDKATYWTFKRQGQSIAELLKSEGNENIDEKVFRHHWLERIESPEYLQWDSTMPGVLPQLNRLRKDYRMVLITLRQDQKQLQLQLERLQLNLLFEAVLSANPTSAPGWISKQHLITRSEFSTAGSTLIGDTEIDIRAGKLLGMRTVGVLSGIRDRQRLEREQPDLIVEDICALNPQLNFSNAN